MINKTKKDDIKTLISKEKEIVKSYISLQKNIKENLTIFIDEFKELSFENEVLKTMFLNNLSNAVVQIDNNLSNIQSLSNVLEILEKQNEISENDIETYNKLSQNVEKDITNIQKFLLQTISNSENAPIKWKKKSQNSISKCKEELLKFLTESDPDKKSAISAKKVSSKSIKKKIDASSSDLLCFFPKSKSDSLVLSTSQENYKISFNSEVAKIYIEDEDFNISLKTSGIQVTNAITNNILFITNIDNRYTIITNSQIEIPTFIQVSKIAKNDDFLEVDITNSYLNLIVENNVIHFENDMQDTPQVIQNQSTPLSTDTSKINEQEPLENEKESILQNEENIVQIQSDDDELKDNDTLIISDSSKTVILPYKIDDLEQKLKFNKKYRSIEEIIKKEYTIPLETFKNPTKSRFREAFQLIKKKEHGSLKEAIELGFELMFQSDLNPAIIAACRDLDELDIYLDCLDDNELEKFSCFKIKYDVPPTKKSKSKGKH